MRGQRVLLGMRAEDSQLEAVGYALALCRDMGARLTVLAVAEEDTADTHWLCVQERWRQEARERTQAALEKVLELARREGVDCSVEGRVGAFEEEVASCAASRPPQLVLIACPPAKRLSLHWCREVAGQLRGRLRCPVVSLVPWGSQAQA